MIPCRFAAALLPLASIPFASMCAFAGPNAGGVLLLHYDTVLNPTCDEIPFCGRSDLGACDEAVTRFDGSLETWCNYGFFVFAAFPEGSSPRVSSVSFGAAASPELVIVPWDTCADLESPGTDWPRANSGTTVSWNTPQTSSLLNIYVFLAYFYYDLADAGTITLTPHPSLGGVFRDDSVPPLEDSIVDYGIMGLNTDGELPACPPSVSHAPDLSTSTTGLSLSAPTPNPSRGDFSFLLRIPNEERVSVTLHDVEGRTVRVLREEILDAGGHDISFSDDELAPGVYFLVARTDSDHAATRLVRIE